MIQSDSVSMALESLKHRSKIRVISVALLEGLQQGHKTEAHMI